ncbi:DEAD/DEAH box helicase [Brevibacterium album]|uniref:DEAD/DEAH box helicase n=1 Tax=Brevibacterium album TaxID=417948 RepID=UPI0003F6C353|nr:DEAD/DEAH box helicase [Brevibacterium album]
MTVLRDFRTALGFELDAFQVEACGSLEAGRSVLVCAPTGAGKTVVAQFAVALARARGVKVFYTAPIKALSNQKYQDLAAEYGPAQVGLLTGDTTINREAPIVVMTTEVLRNMLYSGEPLADLGFVVLDEVHYLGDRFRGPVWEEVIIHLPAHVRIVGLSATVSNAEEFGAWLREVRGHLDVVVTEHRPVPLHSHVMVDGDIHRLFRAGNGSAGSGGANGSLDPDLVRAIRQLERAAGGGGRRGRGRGGAPGRLRMRRTSRLEILRELGSQSLLPAIFFIFSRNGCDEAVEQMLAAGIDLTSEEEKRRIHARLDALLDQMPREDLGVLGYGSFSTGLLHGFAAHHAGMIPQFKEVVEDLFADGCLRAVFATETLALGVNMPARTVVLEKLTKFNGEAHVQVTPGEYTQLTGRAGRRGIDTEGHALVVWHPSIDVADIAALASKRTYALRSRFTPTYNMAANLLARMSREDAGRVLETSFAQFQADQGVVGLARKLRKNEGAIAGYRESMRCERGDFAEYHGLRRAVSAEEKRARRTRTRAKQREVIESLGLLRVGDVIVLPSKRSLGAGVVISPMQNRDAETRLPSILTESGRVWHLRPHEVTEAAVKLGRIRFPKKFNHRVVQQRRQLGDALIEAIEEGRLDDPTEAMARARSASKGPRQDSARVDELQAAIRAHPCHSCPDREDHARWAERADRLEAETAALRAKIEGRTASIAKVFERVCDVLTSLGFLPDSRVLRRIYGERDLVTALAVRGGVMDGLTEPELAALASGLVYTARQDGTFGLPRMPTAALDAAVLEVHGLWRTVTELETQARLAETPEPDFGIARCVFAWTEGASLDTALRGSGIAAGDFVRWAKQTLDVLGQIADVAKPETAARVRRAAAAIRRGVVAD